MVELDVSMLFCHSSNGILKPSFFRGQSNVRLKSEETLDILTSLRNLNEINDKDTFLFLINTLHGSISSIMFMLK